MARKKQNDQNDLRAAGRFQVRFSAVGLLAFSLFLLVGGGVLALTLGFTSGKTENVAAANDDDSQTDASDDAPPRHLPAWGELLTFDTHLERPLEYMATEINAAKTPAWTFTGMNLGQARTLMLKCGLTPSQVDQASAARCVSENAERTVIQPDDALVLSLSPEVRSRFYRELARDAANHYMRFPFCFPGNAFDDIARDGHVPASLVSLVKSLLYRIGDAQYLSDFELIMRKTPSQDERLAVVKALSSQSAVMVRLRIRHSTDVDKLLGYWAWAPGVRFTNLRPLLESLTRVENGSSISLLYFLPPFARERLYTYPLPSQPGDPMMDCHWSTMNFFNTTPDNRFANADYVVQYLGQHYYQVGQATRYGDLIFLLDEQNNAVHSAVYLADDIVFTKNGNNYMTPWMLMRLKNLIATYSVTGTPRVVVYRSRNA